MIGAFLSLASAYFLALLFAGTALHKITRREEFTHILAAYGLLPKCLIATTVWGLTLMEGAVAVALLFPVLRLPATLVAVMLLVLYTLAMGSALWRGRADIRCGCSWSVAGAGTGGVGDGDSITDTLILRNLCLIFVATIVVVPVVSVVGASGTTMEQPMTIGLALIDYSAIDYSTGVFTALAAYLFYSALPFLTVNHRRIVAMQAAIQLARLAQRAQLATLVGQSVGQSDNDIPSFSNFSEDSPEDAPDSSERSA